MNCQFYEALAACLADPQILFLNYGFAGAEAQEADWIHEEDRRHRHHLNLVRRVMEAANLKRKAALEIGCGRGGNCYYLSRNADAERVVGLDLCPANVRLARRAVAGWDVQFLAADAQQLPFAEARFDVVLNLESSHCYPDLAAFFAEVRRVLKPGGRFFYADLWPVPVIAADWFARERALAQIPLRLLSEEDISEQVFQALKSADGLPQVFYGLSRAHRSPLYRRIAEIGGAV